MCLSGYLVPCLVPAVAANDAATKVVAASVVSARGCVELGITACSPVAHAGSVGDALTVVVIMRAVHKALGVVGLKRKGGKLEATTQLRGPKANQNIFCVTYVACVNVDSELYLIGTLQ